MDAKYEKNQYHAPLKIISTGISVPSVTHINFSFCGNQDVLETVFSELSCGSILSSAVDYNRLHLYDSEYQYNVQIPTNQCCDLVKMFEYQQKRLGHYCKPDIHFKIFEKIPDQITYEYDSQTMHSTISNLLLFVVTVASKNKDPLIIKQPPIAANVIAQKDRVDGQLRDVNQPFYNKYAKPSASSLCKIGLFAIATVGIGLVTLGVEAYVKTFEP